MLIALSEMLSTAEPHWAQLFARKGHCTLVTFCNPLTIKHLHQSPRFLETLSEFDLVFADGILLAKAAGFARGKSIPRLSFDGNSLAVKVFDEATRQGYGAALIGAARGVAERAALILEENGFPVPYTHAGYFADSIERHACIEDIKRSGVGVVLVGMGGVNQEIFALALKRSGFKGLVFTCGGYLDQLARGKMAYYPTLINKLNLRAIYRTASDPGRLIPRYTIGYLPFYREALGLISTRILARFRSIFADI